MTSQKNTKIMKRRWMGPTILCTGLIIGSVFVSVASASKGSELLGIEEEIALARERNREIRSEIIEGTSLTKLSERVDELGMLSPQEIVYLKH